MTKFKLIYFVILLSMASSESIKEPDYNLIKKDGKIEIREYSDYVIAKTSLSKGDTKENNSMFRTLAGYIFGGNSKNQSISMTAPVITQSNNDDYNMIFFMLGAKSPEQLPIPNNQNVILEKMDIGKTVSITFGMWATDDRIAHYKPLLDKYISDNKIKVLSTLMVAQYNSPWAIPPFRKNELIYRIK
mgnify:FL=1|jgi:hypothetical protein